MILTIENRFFDFYFVDDKKYFLNSNFILIIIHLEVFFVDRFHHTIRLDKVKNKTNLHLIVNDDLRNALFHYYSNDKYY